MNCISAEDYQAIIVILGSLHECSTRSQLARIAIPGIARLIGSDITSYAEANPVTCEVTGFFEPDDLDGQKHSGLLKRFINEHPVIDHYKKTGDGRAWRISDFITQTEFHATALYRHIYQPMGIEFQISLALPARRPLIAALVFNRKESDFTERDREILDILRPHLTRSFEDARALDRVCKNLIRHKTAMDSLPEGVIGLRGNCRIEIISAKARLWLDAFFPQPHPSSNSLPDEILGWLRESPCGRTPSPGRAPPLIKQRGSERLEIKVIDTPEGQRLLVLRRRAMADSPQALETLGLSPRQAQTLLRVARGHSNKQIARELDISPRTVQKHLETVFKILRVGSRTEASRIAFNRLLMALAFLLMVVTSAFNVVNF